MICYYLMSAQQAWEHLIANGLEVKCLLLTDMDRLSHTLYQLSSQPYCCDLISLFMSFLIIFPSLWKGKCDRDFFSSLVLQTEECGLHLICWNAGLNHCSRHFKLLINCSAKKCTYFLGVICGLVACNLHGGLQKEEKERPRIVVFSSRGQGTLGWWVFQNIEIFKDFFSLRHMNFFIRVWRRGFIVLLMPWPFWEHST